MQFVPRHTTASEPFTLGISWPLIVAVLALCGVLGTMPASRPLSDPDTYWHIAAGRWILEHGAIPTGDPFSHVMPGAPWTTHEWLSEVVLAAAYRVGGWGALAALAAASFAATLALLTRFLLARFEPIHALLFTGLAAGMLMSHLLARPHVLAWPLLALWVGALTDASESRRGPPWWLWAVMMLWANLHGSFTLGLALAGGFAADAVLASPRGERRAVAGRWAAFVALALLAAMVTPSGWQGIWYTVYVMRLRFALSMIGEWQSPNFQNAQPLELWLLLLFAIALTGRVRLPLLRLLMLLGLIHLAMKHMRNTAILGLVSPFLIATPLARQWYAATARGGANAQGLDRWFRALAVPAKSTTVAVVVVLSALAFAAIVPARSPEPSRVYTPQAALQAAKAAGVRGEVLNDYGFGGYLIFQGVKVFLDGRADMYGDAFVQRTVAGLTLADRKTLLDLLEAHRIGWTLLMPGTPAIAVLDELPGWRRVHADNVAVVHMRLPEEARP
ncbi:hypothetical protein [Piscinibacter sp.]|uniref:hypothetical protein n=1 Tax=Piscinibacter sp. TaxID=1903157 RepID=UPI002ED14C4B